MDPPHSGIHAAPVAVAEAAANQPFPFEPGEILTYNITFSKLIFSGYIGQLKLLVKDARTPPPKDAAPALTSPSQRQASPSHSPEQSARPETQAPSLPPGMQGDPTTIEFGAEVASRGFFTRLFGVRIEDRYGAVVRSEDFCLVRSWKDIDQGDLHRHHETTVDRELGALSYSETDRNKRGVITAKTGGCPRWILDLLSAVYFVRTKDLKEGNTITLPVTDVGQVYMIDVVPGKREEVVVEAGKFRSVQLDLKIFDGKYIRRSGQLLVWLSDDAKRLPVKARLKSSGTTVNITLARLEKPQLTR